MNIINLMKKMSFKKPPVIETESINSSICSYFLKGNCEKETDCK